MRYFVLLILVLLSSCATYKPPPQATSRIKFVGNHQYAYIDTADSCSTRHKVDRELSKSVPVADGGRIWIDQGFDTRGLMYGMYCGFRYSFIPLSETTYVSHYVLSGRSCRVSLRKISPDGREVVESTFREEHGISCAM